ncbi:MAG: hypothetical protein LUQ31_10100 [Methanoregula sp.]|nr:hypothetical protein [Methanoregula sp.]
MQIELCRGISVQPGTVNAVIAPETMMISALNSNAGVRLLRFRYICGKYSLILDGINVSPMNFEVRRVFTAQQFFTRLRESDHTPVFVEYDPSLVKGAAATLGPVANTLRNVARMLLVIPYTPVSNRVFSALASNPDSAIRIVPAQPDPQQIRILRIMVQYRLRPSGQRTLEAF